MEDENVLIEDAFDGETAEQVESESQPEPEPEPEQTEATVEQEPTTASTESLLESIRQRRNALLRDVDTVYCNAERWAKMPTCYQKAWSDYKQALRDLPQTVDVNNQVWPDIPAFLTTGGEDS